MATAPRATSLDACWLIPGIRADGSQHLTTGQCGNALRTIFSSAPNVQELSITHGQNRVSARERKMGRVVDPLPGVDGALADLPSSLVKLTLTTFTLAANDFDLSTLPSLTLLTLSDCGVQSVALAEALLADPSRCPKLARKGIYIKSPTFHSLTAGPYSYQTARCLDPAVAAKEDAAREAAAAARKAHVAPGGAGPSGSRPGSAMEGHGRPWKAMEGPSGSRPGSAMEGSLTEGMDDEAMEAMAGGYGEQEDE